MQITLRTTTKGIYEHSRYRTERDLLFHMEHIPATNSQGSPLRLEGKAAEIAEMQ